MVKALAENSAKYASFCYMLCNGPVPDVHSQEEGGGGPVLAQITALHLNKNNYINKGSRKKNKCFFNGPATKTGGGGKVFFFS